MKRILLFGVFLFGGAVWADQPTPVPTTNPWDDLKAHWQWAIDQVSQHQKEGAVFKTALPPQTKVSFGGPKVPLKKITGSTSTTTSLPAAPVTLGPFMADSLETKLTAVVVDYHTFFTVDVDSDSTATGWLLTRKSTKEKVLNGGLNSQNHFKVKVNYQYVRDYHLTVFGADNTAAYLDLF